MTPPPDTITAGNHHALPADRTGLKEALHALMTSANIYISQTYERDMPENLRGHREAFATAISRAHAVLYLNALPTDPSRAVLEEAEKALHVAREDIDSISDAGNVNCDAAFARIDAALKSIQEARNAKAE